MRLQRASCSLTSKATVPLQPCLSPGGPISASLRHLGSKDIRGQNNCTSYTTCPFTPEYPCVPGSVLGAGDGALATNETVMVPALVEFSPARMGGTEQRFQVSGSNGGQGRQRVTGECPQARASGEGSRRGREFLGT